MEPEMITLEFEEIAAFSELLDLASGEIPVFQSMERASLTMSPAHQPQGNTAMSQVSAAAEYQKQAEQPLSAQQMQALAKQHADALLAIKRDVDLRKWAVDQACGLAGAAYEAEGMAVDVVAVGREIHAFLTEAAEGK
jgi:hypothetical protein